MHTAQRRRAHKVNVFAICALCPFKTSLFRDTICNARGSSVACAARTMYNYAQTRHQHSLNPRPRRWSRISRASSCVVWKRHPREGRRIAIGWPHTHMSNVHAHMQVHNTSHHTCHICTQTSRSPSSNFSTRRRRALSISHTRRDAEINWRGAAQSAAWRRIALATIPLYSYVARRQRGEWANVCHATPQLLSDDDETRCAFGVIIYGDFSHLPHSASATDTRRQQLSVEPRPIRMHARPLYKSCVVCVCENLLFCISISLVRDDDDTSRRSTYWYRARKTALCERARVLMVVSEQTFSQEI